MCREHICPSYPHPPSRLNLGTSGVLGTSGALAAQLPPEITPCKARRYSLPGALWKHLGCVPHQPAPPPPPLTSQHSPTWGRAPQVVLSPPVVLARALWVPMDGPWPARSSCLHPGGPVASRPPDQPQVWVSGTGAPPWVLSPCVSCSLHLPRLVSPGTHTCVEPCLSRALCGSTALKAVPTKRAHVHMGSQRAERERSCPGAPCGARAVRGWDGWLQAPAGCHQSEP